MGTGKRHLGEFIKISPSPEGGQVADPQKALHERLVCVDMESHECTLLGLNRGHLQPLCTHLQHRCPHGAYKEALPVCRWAAGRCGPRALAPALAWALCPR